MAGVKSAEFAGPLRGRRQPVPRPDSAEVAISGPGGQGYGAPVPDSRPQAAPVGGTTLTVRMTVGNARGRRQGQSGGRTISIWLQIATGYGVSAARPAAAGA